MDVRENLTRIRAFMQANGWSRFRLAREARLSPNALLHIERADFYDATGKFRLGWNPTCATVHIIEQVIREHEERQREAREVLPAEAAGE